MEDINDMLKLPEESRKEYRNALKGLTPSILFNMGVFESMDKLKELKVSRNLAIGIAYGCVVYINSKPFLLTFKLIFALYILK